MTIAILLTPCGDGQPSSFLCVSFCAGQGFLDFLATSHEESVCCGFNFPIAGEAMHACSMAIERRPVVTQGEGGGLGSAPGPRGRADAVLVTREALGAPLGGLWM